MQYLDFLITYTYEPSRALCCIVKYSPETIASPSREHNSFRLALFLALFYCSFFYHQSSLCKYLGLLYFPFSSLPDSFLTFCFSYFTSMDYTVYSCFWRYLFIFLSYSIYYLFRYPVFFYLFCFHIAYFHMCIHKVGEILTSCLSYFFLTLL